MDYENEYRLMFYCEIRHTGLQGPPCGFNTMQHLNMHVCVMVNYASLLTNYVIAILKQYVINIIIRKLQFIAMLSYLHEFTSKKFSKVLFIDNVYESSILIMHFVWFNHCTPYPAIPSAETLVNNIYLTLNYIVYILLRGHPHVTAFLVIFCFVFTNLSIYDGS